MKKLLMMAAGMVMGAVSALAAGTDISTLDNALYVKDATVNKGKTATLSLQLKNKLTNVQSIGAYITLPTGVTVTKASLVDRSNPTPTKTGAEANYVQTNLVDGVTRLALLGCSGEAISGAEGDVVTLEVTVSDELEAGEYPIAVSNIELCTLDSKATVLEGEIASVLTVSSKMFGDVNSDGSVNIADVNTVLGVINAGGYDNDADVNADDAVNIADVNSVLGVINSGSSK